LRRKREKGMNILEVFTKQYREETKYMEFLKQQRDNGVIRLKTSPTEESIDDKVERLRNLQDIGKIERQVADQ
jgi:ACT domain-containing protein